MIKRSLLVVFLGLLASFNIVAADKSPYSLHKFKFIPVDNEYQCIKQSTSYFPHAGECLKNSSSGFNNNEKLTITVAVTAGIVATGQYICSFFWKKKEEKASNEAKKAHTAVQRMSLDQLYILATQEQEANSPSRYFRDRYEAALHICGAGDGL